MMFKFLEGGKKSLLVCVADGAVLGGSVCFQ